MVQSRGSRGFPRWLVVAGGVALGLALVFAYVVNNLPPDTDELMRASYERGFDAGRDQRTVRGADVRRTPLSETSAS
jgi:hypothetical protein